EVIEQHTSVGRELELVEGPKTRARTTMPAKRLLDVESLVRTGHVQVGAHTAGGVEGAISELCAVGAEGTAAGDSGNSGGPRDHAGDQVGSAQFVPDPESHLGT